MHKPDHGVTIEDEGQRFRRTQRAEPQLLKVGTSSGK